MSASPNPTAAPTASTSRTLAPSTSPQPQSTVITVPKRIEPPAAASAKPKNLFTNDGSFLERFKKNAVPTPDQEKKEREEALARKKALEERFKRRGKRPSSASASTSPTDGATASPSPTDDTSSSSSSKRRRTEDGSGSGGGERPLTEYEKEVRKLESRLLKDEGSSLRPLMK
ncbi:hypothetical protein C6P46_001810 [Rhodotorula mucilaginosa]|uniref:Uncharacterized protein n=1 Tax=Rhodotorula mucilaginosa TaxID=5537 RepID=A0A9P6VSG0_RHOMI|nr:hypothetical protein C6P46_001810 [Rhodotorula mucilaginosa]